MNDGGPPRLRPFFDSEVDPLGQLEGVIDLDAEIPDGALDLPVSEQQLAGPQVSLQPEACRIAGGGSPPHGSRTRPLVRYLDSARP